MNAYKSWLTLIQHEPFCLFDNLLCFIWLVWLSWFKGFFISFVYFVQLLLLYCTRLIFKIKNQFVAERWREHQNISYLMHFLNVHAHLSTVARINDGHFGELRIHSFIFIAIVYRLILPPHYLYLLFDLQLQLFLKLLALSRINGLMCKYYLWVNVVSVSQ